MRVALLVATLLAVVPSASSWAQEERGNRAYRRSAYEESVDRYRKAVERGGATPRVHYNLGTALLRLGEGKSAREELAQVLRTQDPELRVRSFYNLGNAIAETGGQASASELRQAAEAYRRALLLDPGRQDAKWNLELTLKRIEELENNTQPQQNPQQQPQGAPRPPSDRQQQSEPQGSGSPNPQQAQEQQRTPLDDLEAPLPRDLAEQILRAVEERERALQREKQRRRRTPRSGPDW